MVCVHTVPYWRRCDAWEHGSCRQYFGTQSPTPLSSPDDSRRRTVPNLKTTRPHVRLKPDVPISQFKANPQRCQNIVLTRLSLLDLPLYSSHLHPSLRPLTSLPPTTPTRSLNLTHVEFHTALFPILSWTHLWGTTLQGRRGWSSSCTYIIASQSATGLTHQSDIDNCLYPRSECQPSHRPK